jgi:O-antigen/teichoic acid export membrane protein
MVSAVGRLRDLWVGWATRLRGEFLLVLLARLANVGAGTVLVILTARHLGPSGRGEIVLAFTIAWATTSVASLGTSTSGRIGLLRPDSTVTAHDVVSLTAALVPLQLLLSTVVVAVLSVVSFHWSPSFIIAIVALSMATMVFHSAVCLMYGLRRYGEVLIAEVILAVLQIGFFAGLFWSDRLTATSAVAAMAIGPILGAVWLVGRSGGLHRTGVPWGRSNWRTLVVDGLSPMAGDISLFLALRLNRLVVAVYAGTHSLGLFTVALAVPETLRVLPKAVGQVVADRARSGIDPIAVAQRHTRVFVVGHGLVLAAAAAAGWVLFPAIFGEGFADARDVLVLMTAAEFVLVIHLMHQALLVGFGRPKGIGLPQVVGAVVMVVLDLVMIPVWGMRGAAWACLLGFGALAAVSTGWTNRELRRIG